MIVGIEVLRNESLDNWLGIVEGAKTTNKHVLIEEDGRHYLFYNAKPFVPRIASVIVPIVAALIFIFGFKWYVFTPMVVLLPYLTLSPLFWFYMARWGARKQGYTGKFEMVETEEMEDMLWKAAFGESSGSE